MVNRNFDRATLRELADEGNETALDRLADLADARGDIDELSELLAGAGQAAHICHCTRLRRISVTPRPMPARPATPGPSPSSPG
ncbi:MAG: hypothetical protein ACYCVZ_18425 [Streptosporangiaceae bacterium]